MHFPIHYPMHYPMHYPITRVLGGQELRIDDRNLSPQKNRVGCRGAVRAIRRIPDELKFSLRSQ